MLPPFGVFTRKELLSRGLSASAISRRCRSGEFTRLLPRVYATSEVTTLVKCFAVTLWQPDAVLSHRTAAWLWRMCAEPAVVEATVPTHRSIARRAPEWLRIHRRALSTAVVTEARGMAVVTPERALLDCAAVIEGDELDRLYDAQLGQAVNEGFVERRLTQDAGKWGSQAARQQLRDSAVGTDSEPERLVGRALARRGFRLRGNLRVAAFYPDFYDELSRTAIEIDGRGPHSEPEMFRRDRRRQNAMLAAGIYLVRYAAADVLADPEAVADEIVALLRRRRKSLRRPGRTQHKSG
ncbi:DUF559 domain-containing protein [Skermania sp. ID1734]|uniref:type IV toxin-antitoxin system AbiEi family antitoxin domain-containing protein n=1 Tax=Skermania sp. ID1734 TaxID=2597516 RepID=UPI00117CCB2B|nr:type IV toxin-antitoxin system AbiEi family antitoxin domain-containing protein [Skermania sp. ID1734]TSD95113.1 DUF559 domain-containing protein [Skermania sp. ID1734]